MPSQDIIAPPTDDDILGVDNPRSLVNIVPKDLKAAILALPQDLLDMPEIFLERKMWPEGIPKKSCLENRLRLSFWLEYDRAQAAGGVMHLPAVIYGICSMIFFCGKVMKDEDSLAWLIRPPITYRTAMEELLSMGMDNMREILEAPLQTPGGRFDSKLAAVKFQIFQAIDARVKGAIIQRIDQRSLSVNATFNGTTNGDTQKIAPPRNISDIDAKLKELEIITAKGFVPGSFTPQTSLPPTPENPPPPLRQSEVIDAVFKPAPPDNPSQF